MILLFAASFIGYCILYMAFDLYDSSEVPLMVCIQITLATYFVALFAKINIISDILYYGGFAALIAGLWLFMRKKDLRGLLNRLLSPAFVFFILFGTVLYLLCGPVVCVYPDEVAHYGLVPKYMLTADKIPGVDSVVELINYPPGTALFQYHTARFTGGGDGMVFFGQMLLYAALLTIVLKNITWKKLWLGFLSLALAIVVLFKFREYNFISLYTDQIAAMAGFFIAASYLRSDKKPQDILKLLPLVFFTPLIRESGVSFAVFGSVLILVYALFTRKQSELDENKKPLIAWIQQNSAALAAVLLIITAFLSYKIWNLHVDTFHILTYRGLVSTEAVQSGFVEFLKMLFRVLDLSIQNSIVDSPGGWALITTPAGATLLFVTVSLFTNILLKSVGKDEKRLRAITTTVFVELIIYAVGLAFSYSYLFTDVEGGHMAAFSRYMGTIVVYCGLVITYMLANAVNRLEKGSLHLTIAGSVCMILILMMFTATYPVKYNLYVSRATDSSEQDKLDEKTAGIRNIITTEDKVYQIWQGTFDQTYYFARYSLMAQTNTWDWSLGEFYYDNDLFTTEYTVEEWAKLLVDGGYDYVFLGKPDERLWRIYGELFSEVDNPEVDVYKVTPGGEYLLTAWDTEKNAPYRDS